MSVGSPGRFVFVPFWYGDGPGNETAGSLSGGRS